MTFLFKFVKEKIIYALRIIFKYLHLYIDVSKDINSETTLKNYFKKFVLKFKNWSHMVLIGPNWSTKLRTKKSSVLTMDKLLSVQKNLSLYYIFKFFIILINVF